MTLKTEVQNDSVPKEGSPLLPK
ncbi:hypothetical protein AVEN_15912-1, partial [Araneus ventricosus]